MKSQEKEGDRWFRDVMMGAESERFEDIIRLVLKTKAGVTSTECR